MQYTLRIRNKDKNQVNPIMIPYPPCSCSEYRSFTLKAILPECVYRNMRFQFLLLNPHKSFTNDFSRIRIAFTMCFQNRLGFNKAVDSSGFLTRNQGFSVLEPRVLKMPNLVAILDYFFVILES